MLQVLCCSSRLRRCEGVVHQRLMLVREQGELQMLRVRCRCCGSVAGVADVLLKYTPL